jgi:hypothetical protein
MFHVSTTRTRNDAATDHQITVSLLFTIKGEGKPVKSARQRHHMEARSTKDRLFKGFSKRSSWTYGEADLPLTGPGGMAHISVPATTTPDAVKNVADDGPFCVSGVLTERGVLIGARSSVLQISGRTLVMIDQRRGENRSPKRPAAHPDQTPFYTSSSFGRLGVLRCLCCSLEASIARFSVDLTHAAIDKPTFSAAAAYCFKSCSLTRILSQFSFFSSSALLPVNIVPTDQKSRWSVLDATPQCGV